MTLLQEVSGRAFQEMDRVVNLLNRYDSASPLAHLNREGSIRAPPPELSVVLSRAREFHTSTQGAFDPTVQPLVDLFRKGSGSTPPTESAILKALSLVGFREVKLRSDSIQMDKPGMGVTLDGIAKGFVVDRMASLLGEFGLTDFLINAGGDIRSLGRREDGRPWQVGVQDPEKRGDLPDVIGMTGGAVATSGSYEIYFDRERTSHHIVSAGTGASPGASKSVSVVAPTALVADALATSVFVMEPERGIAYIDSLPQCACLIIDASGQQSRSKGWRSTTDLPPSRQG